jgi:hypothetical protein
MKDDMTAPTGVINENNSEILNTSSQTNVSLTRSSNTRSNSDSTDTLSATQKQIWVSTLAWISDPINVEIVSPIFYDNIGIILLRTSGLPRAPITLSEYYIYIEAANSVLCNLNDIFAIVSILNNNSLTRDQNERWHDGPHRCNQDYFF